MADEDELNALSDELESIKETLRINTIQLCQMVEELRVVLPLMDNLRNLGKKIEEIRFRFAEPQAVCENATDTNFQGLLPKKCDRQQDNGGSLFSLSCTHQLGSVVDNIATLWCCVTTYGQLEMVDLASDKTHKGKSMELLMACDDSENPVLGSVKSMRLQDEETLELGNNSNILVSTEKDSGKDKAIAPIRVLQEHNDVDKKPFSRKSIDEFKGCELQKLPCWAEIQAINSLIDFFENGFLSAPLCSCSL
ncbi:hypothetical protein CDL12_28371 [Handroanthus impetiginosus]|uniref:Uncharacterized protein n=1 Tax=Handroanthus impetiginosus TaxID=429701 RepID=A0A2G9G1D3_9LAMI|nr:hypothetical protein CDL12_28371 [Handroanthus impetiginosus]